MVREYAKPRPHYHRQDTADYCGNTCVQMILNSLLLGDGHVRQQSDLVDDLRNPSWYAVPRRIAEVLTKTTGTSFDLINCTNESVVSRKLVTNIFDRKPASIALVYGFAHWVVVYGCEVSAKPEKAGDLFDPTDRNYDIEAFYVLDPAPEIAAGSQTFQGVYHKESDECGSGGTLGAAALRVPYKDWVERYLTGVTQSGLDPDYSDQFLAVVNAPQATSLEGCDTIGRLGNYDPRPAPPNTDADKEEAKKAAERGLVALMESRRPPDPWKKRLKGRPIATWLGLVGPNITAIPGFYYYLVEVSFLVDGSPDKSTPVAVLIEPGTLGEPDTFRMMETYAIPKGKNITGRIREYEDVRRMMQGAGVKLKLQDSNETMITDGDEESILEVRLVWEHSMKSMTPLLPYYKITLRGQTEGPGRRTAIESIYVRIDDSSLMERLGQRTPGQPLDLSAYVGLYGPD